MKNQLATYLIAACVMFSGAGAPINAQAQSEVAALSAVSAWPVASVVLGASAAAGAVLAIPVVLSTAGAVLVERPGPCLAAQRAADQLNRRLQT